jgi:hypothetical protein
LRARAAGQIFKFRFVFQRHRSAFVPTRSLLPLILSPGTPCFGPPARSRARSRFLVARCCSWFRFSPPEVKLSPLPPVRFRFCCSRSLVPHVGLAVGVRPSHPHRCSFRVSSLPAARSSSAAREQPPLCLVLRSGRISARSFIFPLEHAARFSISRSFLLLAADLLSSLIFSGGPGLVLAFVILLPQEVPPRTD